MSSISRATLPLAPQPQADLSGPSLTGFTLVLLTALVKNEFAHVEWCGQTHFKEMWSRSRRVNTEMRARAGPRAAEE
jgi:hypothetical protein